MSQLFLVHGAMSLYSCTSLQSAAAAIRKEIEFHNLGSREWYSMIESDEHGAIVRDSDGNAVASISYNGRIWTTKGGTWFDDAHRCSDG